MWTDHIVDEIHRIRLAHVEKFHYDLRAVFDDLKEHEKKNRGRLVSLPIKRRQPVREIFEAQESGLIEHLEAA